MTSTIQVFGRQDNKWVNMVCEELDARGAHYDVCSEFSWARDAGCNTLNPHFHEGRALIQKMPTIHLKSGEVDVAQWLRDSKLKYPLSRWNIGQTEEFWITGVEDCLEFIRGVEW